MRDAITGLQLALVANAGPGAIELRVTAEDGRTREFQAIARVDTPDDVEYHCHGGLLPYVLRGMLSA